MVHFSLFPATTHMFSRRKKKCGNVYHDCKEARGLPKSHEMVWQAWKHRKRMTCIVQEVCVAARQMQLN